MTINRSVGISAGLHLLILAGIALFLIFDRPTEILSESIDIRIRVRGESSKSGSVSGGEPSNIPRETRQRTDAPQSEISRYESSPKNLSRQIPETSRMVTTEEVSTISTMGSIDPILDSVATVDPLAGLEISQVETEPGASGSSDHWSLSWSNGRERGIFYFPSIDTDSFPVSVERLSDIEVAIRVSPAGNVVSAEVIAPGSGDIRVDRYINNLSLELVLESGFIEEGDQEGILRLVFSGVDQ